MTEQNRKIIKDGKAYRRVSDIVSPFRGCANDYLKALMEQKALIGTEVHELCTTYACRGTMGTATSDRVSNYTQCFKEFHDENLMFDGVLLSEERFFDDELMLTGQVDLVYRLRDSDAHMLVDLKTSAKAERYQWGVQGSLYAKMLQDAGIELSSTFIFLQLHDVPGKPPTIHAFPKWKENLPELIDITKEIIDHLNEEEKYGE